MPAHLSEKEMAEVLDAAGRRRSAGAPRSRDPRAVLRVGPAPERARRAGPRRREPERADGACARQGREGAARAVQHARPGAAFGCYLAAAATRSCLMRARGRDEPLFVNFRGTPADHPQHRSDRPPLCRRRAARGSASARTRSGIRLPRICSSAARISARSRSCSVMHGSAPRSATPTSTPRSCSRCTGRAIRGRHRAGRAGGAGRAGKAGWALTSAKAEARAPSDQFAPVRPGQREMQTASS